MSKITVGVDEAGRGPVLGPLVMVALAVDEEGKKQLEWMGVKDSKLLSSSVREEMFERIKEVVKDFRVEVVEPDAIDLSLQEEGSNLNWLEADTSARLVAEMTADRIIMDCPSINMGAYKDYLLQKLSTEAELVVEHKADLNYIEVAAASVVAKVIRDRYIDRLKTEIGIDFGSGYMSDPKTKEFLDKYHDKYPHVFRKKWQSFKDAQVKKEQKGLDEF